MLRMDVSSKLLKVSVIKDKHLSAVVLCVLLYAVADEHLQATVVVIWRHES